MTTKREMKHLQGGEMDAQLEEVLDAYAASEPGPSRATLAEWIRDYPKYARELTEFTAGWQLLEWADESSAIDATETSDAVPDDDRLLLRGMSAAQSAFYALRAKRQREADATHTATQSASKPAGDVPISSLFAAAKRAGLSAVDLKDRVGLSDALLQKLNRRLIDPLTIPIRILSDLAAALQQNVQAVAAYTRLVPTFAAGAQHRANQAPALPKEREDFFDAVRNDLTLLDTRKQEILALPRPGADDANPTREG